MFKFSTIKKKKKKVSDALKHLRVNNLNIIGLEDLRSLFYWKALSLYLLHTYYVPVLCVLNCFSCIWLFVTLWTAAHKAPLSLGFSRQECWSGLPAVLQQIFQTQGSRNRGNYNPNSSFYIEHFSDLSLWSVFIYCFTSSSTKTCDVQVTISLFY